LERGPAGFARATRLTRPVDYRRVFASADRSSGRALTLLVAANTLGRPRLGMAVSRKAVARAVDRNRIKRVIRETFRSRQADLGGWDIVVLARAGAAKIARRALRAELEEHWNRLKRRPCAPSSSG
jgi:ribonuclease P protein component